ncbi:ATP synthase subunit C lysine N-methyltransferase isoform X3 [Betta splendens]|uniref:ATP synthase subunit C lysine N-methyltransferase isoform X3 n=1 Tax=Betta splendens TaxID=158456 RepID=A0A6P7NNV5_BETSP|nr:ATP synthase subunit C lysine N-methyltransferase isoform X3 [Betta splendens]
MRARIAHLVMEDSIEVILQDQVLPSSRPHPVFSACTGALLAGLYGVWSLFVLPGFRKIPWKLKVFAASSAGFQCTGFEINSILVALARSRARWTGVPSTRAAFVKSDFWKTDLSAYNNVTAFLAPGVMEALAEKLLAELPDGARVVACRFPFPRWPHQASAGAGLDQTFAYDIGAVRSHLRRVPSAAC